MTPTYIETVIAYLKIDHEKLSEVSISILADVVRWVDKLLGTFTIVGHSLTILYSFAVLLPYLTIPFPTNLLSLANLLSISAVCLLDCFAVLAAN